jgi:hypothetical protein
MKNFRTHENGELKIVTSNSIKTKMEKE